MLSLNKTKKTMCVSEENVKEVLKAFDYFHKLCETETIESFICKEDILKYFKIALFVETTVKKFKTKKCLDEFFAVLKSWNECHKCTIDYTEDFYSTASDHLLEKFFRSGNVSTNTVDIALRMYTALHPKERLQTALYNLILTSASFHYILDIVCMHKNQIDSKELEAHLLMNRWSRRLKIGKSEELTSIVEEMMSTCNVETSLEVLIKVLALDMCDANEKEVKEIILNKVLKWMGDRSILSKKFWLTMFTISNKTILVQVALKFNDFFIELCNFIVYIGSMMNKELNTWVGDPNASICPEISYYDLIDMIQCIYNSNDTFKAHIKEIVAEAQTATGSLIWKEIESKIMN